MATETLVTHVDEPDMQVIFSRSGEKAVFPGLGEVNIPVGETMISFMAKGGPIYHGDDYRPFGWVHNPFTGRIRRKFISIDEGYTKAWAGRFDSEGHGLVYIERVYRKTLEAHRANRPYWEATVKELHATGISHAICGNDPAYVREYIPHVREVNAYDSGGPSYRWNWKEVAKISGGLKNLEMGAKMVHLDDRWMDLCKRSGIARKFLEEAFEKYWMDHPEWRAKKHTGDVVYFMIDGKPYVYHVIANNCDFLELHKITWAEDKPEYVTL